MTGDGPPWGEATEDLSLPPRVRRNAGAFPRNPQADDEEDVQGQGSMG